MMDWEQCFEGAAGAAVLASAGVLAYAVRYPSSSLLAPSVYRGTSQRRAIALTFDDGPSESTPRLLEILASHRAPATFFQCGASVRRLPQVAREVAAAGHEIGNHSDTHPKLHFKSSEFIYRELAGAQEAIQQATGIQPRYFRAPFGIRWFGLREAQQRLGLMGVMWTAIAVDWKWPADRVIERLLHGAGNGAIFCLHDGRLLGASPDIRVTLQTVREVLPKLMEKGFHFEKVSEILCPTKN
ncbi:MAG: polysaccharide deacetylase family protein [Acidobacteriia bacterium]|nr:polysaccharide deacetylase family protein [Terriglobia bacterium]